MSTGHTSEVGERRYTATATGQVGPVDYVLFVELLKNITILRLGPVSRQSQEGSTPDLRHPNGNPTVFVEAIPRDEVK
jgi:hypothetical protein